MEKRHPSRTRLTALTRTGLFLLALGVFALALTACAGDDSSEENAGSEAAPASVAQGAADAGAASSAGITVTGTGSATGVPDQAQFSFGVTTTGSTADQALEANSSVMNEVIDALRGAGVAEEDLQTQQVSVFPRFSEDGRSIVSWTASNSVSALVRDIEQAGEVIDAAVDAGANQISGPFLTISDTDELTKQALEGAMADAQSKAQAIADAAGVTLGGIVSIVESGAPIVPGPFPVAEAAVEAGAVPIEPGTQEVRASVTVTYEIG